MTITNFEQTYGNTYVEATEKQKQWKKDCETILDFLKMCPKPVTAKTIKEEFPLDSVQHIAQMLRKLKQLGLVESHEEVFGTKDIEYEYFGYPDDAYVIINGETYIKPNTPKRWGHHKKTVEIKANVYSFCYK